MRKKKRLEISPPKNKIASKAYHEHYGKLLAEEKIWEIKSSKFGNFISYDRFADLAKLPAREGYTSLKRKQVYEKALHLYSENELVRPVINIIASSIFSSNSSNPSGLDVRGKNEKLVTLAQNLIDHNELSFHDLAREGEMAGDVFLWFEPDGDKTRIWSLDAGSVDSVLRDNDIRNISGYVLSRGSDEPVTFDPYEIQHLKFNATSTSQYGRSSLRHLIYWFDVLDSLFEKNWLRGAEYYGNPQLAISGVPGPYQESVRGQLEGKTQRAGRVLILPPDSEATPLDYTLGFPIGDIVGWVFRLIAIGSEVPITLLGTADASSRGSAFFANPRLLLAVRAKREVWRIGLRGIFIKIFRALGMIPENQVVPRREFDIGFFPVFERDLSELSDVIEVYRDRKLISKKSAREMIGLDHSDEEEEMAQEPKEEPIEPSDGKLARRLKSNKAGDSSEG